MTTEAVRYELFQLCADGRHDQCMGGWGETTTIDGQALPAVRCNCSCGHTAQQERLMRGDD